jgi:Flp pilus assembly pilin Flp
MVEYSLILLLVALAIFVIFVTLGHRVSDLYSNINNGLNTAAG